MKSSLSQAMCVEAVESASQADAEIETSAISLDLNAKSVSSLCLVVSVLLDLNHLGVWPSLPPPFAQQSAIRCPFFPQLWHLPLP